MGKNDKVFKAGDFVFAKIKGYRPWPAKVMIAEGKYKYSVYFFGTKEFGKRLKASDMFNYTDTKARHGKLDNAKKEFSDAIAQIEAAISGNDISPPLENFDLEKELERSRVGDDLAVDKSVVEEEVIETSKAVENGKKKLARKESEEEAQDIENEVVATTIKKTSKKRALNASDSVDNVAAKERATANKTNKSPASIKPTVNSEDTENSVSPPKKTATKPGIVDPRKTELLRTELKLWSSILDIKKSLSLEKANTRTCIQLLETLKNLTPNITQLMLKKHPNCVEVIRRLKRYVGNTPNWGMNEEEVKEFSASATKIRDIAADIYEEFKRKFNFTSENKSFWEKFTNIVTDFESLTQDQTENFVSDLCFEEEITAKLNSDEVEEEMSEEDIPDN